MGYSNKRRRCKRRRTRTLNALQNHINRYHEWNSADDSSVELQEQSSSYTSFFSTHSDHSYSSSDSCMIPPNSIFCQDDVGPDYLPDFAQRNSQYLDSSEDDQCSMVGLENVDQLLNYAESPIDDLSREDDDVTLQSITSCSESSKHDEGFRAHGYPYHCFDQMTRNETASYKIMTLLDAAGAPRICYNRLVALLKKLSRHEGFDVKKALNRETLMKRLERKCKRPRIQSSLVDKHEVFRFKFHDVLQDLLLTSSKHLHEIVPSCEQDNPEVGTEHELWNTPWMKNTFATEQYTTFDPKRDVMLPIILYMDKTGTDVNQRYSLEPVLFSVASIPRAQRESRHSWRHLGFIPQKKRGTEDESSSDLQFYHNCLSYLLDGLREAQKEPPIVSLKSKEGRIVQRRALLPLMVVMGDQLSQDTLCGRLKSNAGGAGRVHRSCMCSYLNIDDPYHECRKVDVSTLNYLSTFATTSDESIDFKIHSNPTLSASPKENRNVKTFLLRQRAMFRSILRHPFTSHSITNAFNGIDFGSWPAGIHDATLDDFMHSVEAGMMSYITETVYDGLTKKEKETVEKFTRAMLDKQRCSVVSTYPRWRLQPGFSRQTLMTSGERVGSVLALSLSLHHPTIRETIRIGHSRQTHKYLDLSLDSPTESQISDGNNTEKDKKAQPSAPEFYLDQHMHTLDDPSIRHTMEHMIRHGFSIDLIDSLDPFQINQMIWHSSDIFKSIQYPESYPNSSINGIYTDLGGLPLVPKKQFLIVKRALQTKPSKLLESHQYRRVEGATAKHLKKKTNKKGEGSSAAVLTNNMGTLVIFLEYVLCYHAFCKYSWSLPVFLQRSYENIKAGNRFVVEYFQKLIYRGNNTVDSRFPKIHAQCRMGENITALNTVMHFCCETGERLLKTEAKGISRTAQQRGDETFVTQTMSRLQERSMLDSLGLYLEENENDRGSSHTRGTDHFGRTHPHFVYDPVTERIFAMNRKNEPKQPDAKSGNLDREVTEALKNHEPQTKMFAIYNEVILRDNSRLRASPNYANSGPWYDFANVVWEQCVNGEAKTYLLPAKCLCFFRKEEQENGSQEVMALIHSVDQGSKGKVDGRIDTLLTQNYRMEFDKKGKPLTHVVPVASIDSSVRCFPHSPSQTLFNPNSPGVTYMLPRNHWAYMWMSLNDALQETNSTNKIKQRKGKLNSLCSNQWLEHVRERYHIYLHATCKEDL